MDIEKLVKKAQKGNDKAYLKLFQHYEEFVYRTAFIYVKNKEDALDIVQETAYQSFKSIGNLREPKYFKTWLIKIAMNCSLNMLRQQKKIVLIKPEMAEQLEKGGEEDIPLSVTLHDLLDTLDTNEKNVIILKYYYDYTIQTIAEMIDLPLGSTKTILYRGLSKLRKNLKKGEIS